MALVKQKQCSGCAAFSSEVRGKTLAVPGQVKEGECHLKAPCPNIRPDVLTQWPIVPADGWCLEFRPVWPSQQQLSVEEREGPERLPQVIEAKPGEVTGLAGDASPTAVDPVVPVEPFPQHITPEKKKKKKGSK